MDNPETLVTHGTQDTGRGKQNKGHKTKKMSITDPTNNRGESRCSRRVDV
jgi:hypothetical protein